MCTSRYVVVLLLPLLGALGGCASTDKRPWGEEGTLLPGWSALKNAAYHAAVDPKTWVPLAGATLVYATDQDERISAWAVDNQLVFGNDAGEVGDRLKGITDASYTLTALLTPSGDEPLDWLVNKTQGFLVGNASFAVTNELTDVVKERAGRMRPNGENTRSFISGHTTHAASRVALALRNVEYIAMPEPARTATNVGIYSLNAGMAWSRVEAGVHYPSDVLAAMAVGNFVANFFNDAFLAPVSDSAQLSVAHSLDGTLLVLSLRY